MYLRYNVAHVNIRIRIFRVEYSLDLHELVDQLEHPVILRILQRLADTTLSHNAGYHMNNSYNHQNAR